MEILFLQNVLLITAPVKGFLWFLFFFSLCFFSVHAAKILRAGWRYYQKQKSPPPKPTEQKEEKKAPAKQEPIYYIVERKRRRVKSPSRNAYGEPKQISFK